MDKLSSLLETKPRIIPRDENPYQCDKISHFNLLPTTSKEIIFLGDSLTDYCEWAELFADIPIKNRGISGDRTDGVLSRLDDILKPNPQKIFLMIGINDLIQGVEISEILCNYKIILERIKAETTRTEVFIKSILPINNQKSKEKLKLGLDNEKVIEVNTKLQELAKEFSFQYIDLFSSFSDSNNELDARYTTDGVHLNGQAYLLWKKLIETNVIN